MGTYHLNALKALQRGEFENYYKGDSAEILSNIEICGVCDINKETIAPVKDIAFLDNYQELINSKKPDIVIIATPTSTHFEIARFALENKVNIFVEKPIVVETKQLDELIDIAKKNQVKLMAGHIERYNPVSLKLKELLIDYKDHVKKYHFTRVQLHDPRISDDIIDDKLIHDLDLSLFFFGEINAYHVIDYKIQSGQVYELTFGIEHKNASGKIFVSWLDNSIRREIDLQVAGKKIKGDFLNKNLKVGQTSIKCRVPQWIESENNQVKDEIVDFIVHCFSKNKNLPSPLLSVQEIGTSVKIIEKISSNLNK